ncbi:response regulator [bacterium]|nr:response regulator [bacterium]
MPESRELKSTESSNVRQLIAAVALELHQRLRWEMVVLGWPVRDGGTQRCLIVSRSRDGGVSVHATECSPTRLFRRTMEGRGVLVDAAEELEILTPLPVSSAQTRPCSTVSVPIRSSNGDCMAVVELHRASAPAFTANDLQVAQESLHQRSQLLSVMIKLEEREQEWEFSRRALERIGVVVYERSYLTRQLRWAGDGLERLTGYSREELTPELWRQMTQEVVLRHEPPGTSLDDAVARGLSGATTEWLAEIRFKTKLGSDRWLLDSSIAVRDPAGHPLGSVGILQDITATRQASRLREHLNQIMPRIAALGSSRDIAAATLQAIRALVPWDCAMMLVGLRQDNTCRIAYLVDTDEDGHEKEFTDTYPATHTIGTDVTELIILHPLVNRGESGGSGPTPSLPHVGFVNRRSRSLMFAPMNLGGDRPIGIVSIQSYGDTPYTEGDLETLRVFTAHCAEAVARAVAEEQRGRLQELARSSEKLESLGVLAGGIAHEFNNLLSAILGNVGLIRLDYPEDTPAASGARAIEEAALRMRDLTRQMLAFSGRTKSHPEDTRVETLIAEVRELVRLSIGIERKIQWGDPPTGLSLRCDATQIKQALLNILRNAVEASRASDEPICVTIVVRQVTESSRTAIEPHHPPASGDYLLISVEDYGEGMTETTKARLTDPFFSTRFQGRGLGMATVKGIIDAHRGGLGVISEPGDGAVVTLYLPLSASQNASAVSGVAGESVPARLSGRILIVDDEPSVIDVATRFLQRLGLRSVPSVAPQTALDLFRRAPHDFDAALIDVTMPGMDGIELTRQLRVAAPRLPIVLMSGFSALDVREHFQGEEGIYFVEKPFGLDRIHGVLARALGGAPR